jgi:hypothetical protein
LTNTYHLSSPETPTQGSKPEAVGFLLLAGHAWHSRGLTMAD